MGELRFDRCITSSAGFLTGLAMLLDTPGNWHRALAGLCVAVLSVTSLFTFAKEPAHDL